MSVMRRMREISAAACHDALDKDDDPLRLAARYLQVLSEQTAHFAGLYHNMLAHAENVQKKSATDKRISL